MNTFGQLFRVTTFGESHGPAIGCVIDGCPPGVTISPDDFRDDLARRATGRTRHTSQRHEADEVEIISGVYEGRTTGTPIALLVRNTDAKSKDYDAIAQTFRPGHADYTYWQKYGHRDPRGGGRSSARETTMRVAAAVLAKRWLNEKFGVRVRGHLAQIGNVVPRGFDWSAVEGNPFFWPDASQVPELEAYMDALRKSGDSVGARITVCADGVPPGWGEPIYGKLDGELAAALMSINAVKGVEVGDGFAVVAQHGTEHRDEISETGFCQTTPAASSAAFPPGSKWSCRRRSSRLRACACPRAAWTWTASPSKWSPPVATTPAWACAPRPSARRWSPSC